MYVQENYFTEFSLRELSIPVEGSANWATELLPHFSISSIGKCMDRNLTLISLWLMQDIQKWAAALVKADFRVVFFLLMCNTEEIVSTHRISAVEVIKYTIPTRHHPISHAALLTVIATKAWFSFAWECREHVKLTHILEYQYISSVFREEFPLHATYTNDYMQPSSIWDCRNISRATKWIQP